MNNILNSTVELHVEGALLEKFINMALSLGIQLYNTRTHGKTMTAHVHLSDFYRLRPVARATSCRIYIRKRHGFAIFAGSIKYRVMLFVGMALCVAAICAAQTRIFLIDISGSSGYENTVLEELENMGIMPGIAKSEIDVPLLENEIIKRIPEIAWVSMEVTGMKLHVNAATTVQSPEIVDRHTPSTLVADRDAIISVIETQSGTPLVKPGDAVKEGQVLISGSERSFDGSTRQVRAIGTVMGEITIEGIGAAPVYEEVRTPTGREATVHSLRIHNWFFSLDVMPEFENYDKIIKTLDFVGVFFPAGKISENFFEVTIEKKQRDVAIIKQEALILADIDAHKLLPEGAEVVDKRVNFSMIDTDVLSANVSLNAVISITKEMK